MNTPTWTDIIQAIGAMIAIPGALAAFVLLFRKDKARQSEIKSLSEMAKHLSQMIELSERRQKLEKKPHWKIVYSRVKMMTTFYLTFTNTNKNTSIGSFYIKPVPDEILRLKKFDISENEGSQCFRIEVVPVDYSSFTFAEIELYYDTFDGLSYKQVITVKKGMGPDYTINYGTVIEDSEL